VDDEKQCRICLQGYDAALGRLIKPCKCDGSIRYVHVECLNRWRRASTSKSAFFECPQCHYRYAFARTRVVGLATSPLILSALSLNIFVVLVFLASFVGSFIVNRFDDSDDGYYSYWFYNPITAARDLITSAVHLADEVTGSSGVPTKKVDWSTGAPQAIPKPPGIIGRLLQRFFLGLSVVGITSFAQWLWSMSLMGPMRFLRLRGLRDRRERGGGGSVIAIIIAGFIVAGAVRALLQVYRLVERMTKQLLIRAEYTILEVGV